MTVRAVGQRIIVLVPQAERFERPEVRPIAPRLTSLTDTRIAFVDNGFLATAILHHEIRQALAGSSIRSTIEHKRYWQPLDPTRINDLATRIDAVIGGLCHTPPSSAWAVHDAVEFESRGIPSVTLTTAQYEDLVAESAVNEGMPDLRRVVLPHPLEAQPEELVRAVAARAVAPIIAALADSASPTVDRVAAPTP